MEKGICKTCNKKISESTSGYTEYADGSWHCGLCLSKMMVGERIIIRFTEWQEPFIPRGSTNDIPGLSDKPNWERYKFWRKNGGFIEPLLTSFNSGESQTLIEGICFDTKDLADHIKKMYEQQGDDKAIRIFFNKVRTGNFPVIETTVPRYLILGKEDIISIELVEKERMIENIEVSRFN
jgi:hypothetical protein